MPARHEIPLQESEQHITTAIEHGTDLQEIDEDRPQVCILCGRLRRRSDQIDDGHRGPGNAEHYRQRQQTLPRRQLPTSDHSGRQSGDEQRRKLIHAKVVPCCDHDRQQAQQPRLHRFPTQTPQGLQDDTHDHRLDTVQQAGKLRQAAILDIGPGNRRHQHHGRKGKAHPRHQQPRPAGAKVADVNRQFSGIGTRNQIDRTQ